VGKAMMEYKGYLAGLFELDPEENTFSGTVAGLRDVIYFEGTMAKELARVIRALHVADNHCGLSVRSDAQTLVRSGGRSSTPRTSLRRRALLATAGIGRLSFS
jgi:hypothetical protein